MVGEPANFDLSNTIVLQEFLVHGICLIWLIMAHEQSLLLNIEIVKEKPVPEANDC